MSSHWHVKDESYMHEHTEPTYSIPELLTTIRAADEQQWNLYGWSMPSGNSPDVITNESTLKNAMPCSMEHESNGILPAPHLNPYRSSWVLLPQIPYLDGKAQELSNDDVHFKTESSPGISLSDALHDRLDELRGRDECFTRAKVTSKISLRVQFQGHEPFHRQVMALRSTSSAEPIALGKMAHKIAKQMKEWLNGETLVIEGRTFPFANIFLHKLRRVSQGSWQPEFWASM